MGGLVSVLISGCSTGIGLGTALFLKEQGLDVIASARKENDVLMLKEKGLKAILLDVNSSSSIKAGVKEAIALSKEGIDVLINNAGYGQAGALEDLSRETLRAQFETNVFGLMELTSELLPHMREQKTGRIINVSSILGVISLPFRGAYNASKYAVEGLSDTLRLELSNTAIKVSLIEPGPVASQFRDTCINQSLEAVNREHSVFKNQYEKILNKRQEGESTSFMKTPEAVAKKILHAIQSNNPKPRYRVTLPAHIFASLKHILTTRMLDRLLRRASKSELT
jgi:short-subunit dehydrogenase